jgi:N-hydroxyarylamine O-acetyltransferase
MAGTTIDVARYFARIGYSGDGAATLDTLRALVLAHAQSIPFESLSPYMGRPVPLDLAALERKLILGGRGGYCFEHNLLLSDVLRQLGFSVAGLAARVMWNAPPSAQMPRSHMLIRVDLGTPYLVDVGFGGLTLTGALELRADVEQATPHEKFRLLQDAGEFVMQASVRGEWRPLYRFDLQPQLAADYEPINWYLSTHPESRFVKNLIAARVTPDRRYALLNRELAIHPLHGDTERRTLNGVDELIGVLERDFLIDVPKDAASIEMLAHAWSPS